MAGAKHIIRPVCSCENGGALKINREKSTDLPAVTQYSIVSMQLAE